MRTSRTHPLQIGTLHLSPRDHLSPQGRIGLTFLPGKVQPHAASGAWNRDLDLDLDAIEEWGAEVVLSLVESHEFDDLKVPEARLSEGLRQRGIAWLHQSIPDVQTPGEDFEAEWTRCVGPILRHRLRHGGAVVLHCKGGLGRTGLVAARLLVELEEAEPADAIRRVREVRKGAIETREQERHVEACAPVDDDVWTREIEAKHDRVRASLLGGAIGDALGAGIEFLHLPEIRSRFGERGAEDYVPAYQRDVAITDDTQMTLFTAEGLCRSFVRGHTRGICCGASVTGFAYRRWALTQGERASAGLPFLPDEFPDGWLIRRKELHTQRAPGNTCLSALRQAELGTLERSINDSKGCGGVMRVAPVGFLPWSSDEIFRLGCEVAALTHGHPTGFLSSGALAVILHGLDHGLELLEAIDLARSRVREEPHHEETGRALDQALRLAEDGSPSPEKVESLGGGWVAEEALAIGVYCSLVPLPDPPDRLEEQFRQRLLLAVNHSGDSDSTGSIAGQILGARYGTACLPDDLVSRLESRDLVESLSFDLVTLGEIGLLGGTDAWRNRYPGW